MGMCIYLYKCRVIYLRINKRPKQTYLEDWKYEILYASVNCDYLVKYNSWLLR